jgi:hypothetical protein
MTDTVLLKVTKTPEDVLLKITEAPEDVLLSVIEAPEDVVLKVEVESATSGRWTVEMLNTLSRDITAPRAARIESITALQGNPVVTILLNGNAYAFGDSIALGDTITVQVDVFGVINLNIRYE